MAKRFIDTGFLDQKWIRKLSPEKKIFVIYLMLKCDNGGIIDLDLDDAEFWIGKKIGDPLKFLPEGFLIPVIGDKFLIPKFLKWQYPNFPNSKVHQQRQGIKILTELQVFDPQTNSLHKTYLNFTQSLPNSQVIVNDNDNGDVIGSDNGDEKTLIFPFDSELFLKWWAYWKEYKKKEHKFNYKSKLTEQAGLKGLANMVNGDEQLAIKTIEHTIANAWKGFVIPKNANQNDSDMDSYRQELIERANK